MKYLILLCCLVSTISWGQTDINGVPISTEEKGMYIIYVSDGTHLFNRKITLNSKKIFNITKRRERVNDITN